MTDKERPMSLEQELREAINRHSAENGSNTPDYVLAAFLVGCLAAFDAAVRAREAHYGRSEPEEDAHFTGSSDAC